MELLVFGLGMLVVSFIIIKIIKERKHKKEREQARINEQRRKEKERKQMIENSSCIVCKRFYHFGKDIKYKSDFSYFKRIDYHGGIKYTSDIGGPKVHERLNGRKYFACDATVVL